jgi:light-regulated signal transduction histidine kinase (bacteriophytochrome)
MKEYSEGLVAKLEERNGELRIRNKALEESELRYWRLNEELESRVAKRTEELTAANRELEAFSYSVSHDLRAPLRHILGYADSLSKNPATQSNQASQYDLLVISKAAKRMGQLIDDLLQFSRMNRSEMHTRKISLDQVVEDSLEDLEDEMKDRQITWKISPLGEVQGDPSMLRQVLVNLIGNALKFTRTRARAEIEIGSIPGSPVEVVAFVKDNGVGFDMAYAEKLFGVLQRLHRQEEFEGTGIGLANVQRIIQRHGGHVWPKSIVDAGATFYFSLSKPPPCLTSDGSLPVVPPSLRDPATHARVA